MKELNRELEEYFKEYRSVTTETVEGLWETIKDPVLYPAGKVLSNSIRRKKMQHITDEIFDLLEERRNYKNVNQGRCKIIKKLEERSTLD